MPENREPTVVTVVEPDAEQSGIFLTLNQKNSAATTLKLLKDFVSSQLKEGVDYGLPYPNAPKPALLEPGAEKLRCLFSLSAELERTDQIMDHENGFIMFTYKCTVRDKNGRLIAVSEGSQNSLETKAKRSNVYDQINTLQKMAAKRAFVGAIKRATNASDFFTQDIEDEQDARALGIRRPPAKVQGKAPKQPVGEARPAPLRTSSEPSEESGPCLCPNPECGEQMILSKWRTRDGKQQMWCPKCNTKLAID